jgi:hypothetical protein
MNTKEIGEIRRRQRRDRSNMTHVYGCYINDKKEIISQFSRSTGMMSENEAEKYFALFRRTLGGTQGKNLLDITFRTAQVAESPEHKMLMKLRGQGISDEENRMAFFRKIMESLSLEGNYLILLGTDSYDVPFKSRDGELQNENSDETYTYVLCAICPVKQTKAVLHYEPSTREFQDGNMMNAVAAPELGFLFPAFDGRATNIYNALYFNRTPKDNHEAFVTAVFNTPVAKPAQEQKESFEGLLSSALDAECSLEVVQAVHDQVCQQIALHKESKVPEALTITKDQFTDMLEDCGISEARVAKFSVDFEQTFGLDANVYPANIIDTKKIEIKTPDVSIMVAPDRSDLIQTRVIGGVKYILIQADENVEVNGVNIHIGAPEPATV